MKPKTLYKGYLLMQTSYAGEEDRESRRYLGQTWAVSEEKAINNISHRTGIRPQEFVEYWGDGGCMRTIEVETVK